MYISTDTEVIGYYVLILSILSYMLYFTGFEYHSISNRSLILSTTESEKFNLIGKQFSFYLISNLICSSTISVMYYFKLINIYSVFIFVALMFFEHISLEMSRILIALKRQLSASFMVFIKSFGWIAPFMLFFSFSENKFTIDDILYFWLSAALASVILGFYFLSSYLKRFKFKLNLLELKCILSSSAIIFISTILIRSVAMVDKVYIENYLDLDTLAVYGFFLSISAFITIIMEVAFFQYVYQKMVSYSQFTRSVLNQYYFKILIFCSFLSVLLAFSVWFGISVLFVKFIDSIYVDNINVLPIMLTSFCFMNLSFCCHYYIYSLKYDVLNLISNFSYFLMFITLIYFYGADLYGVAWSLLCSSVALFMLKFFFVIISLNKKIYGYKE